MLKALRVVILVVLAIATLAVVMAIGRTETGPFEKLVLAAVVPGLLALAVPVRRLGPKI
jgi:hypothetical protein